MADLKLTADFTDLQTLKRELLDIPKKARDSARTFEAEFARAERILVKQAKQFQRNAQESQKFYSELLQLNNATKDAERSAQVFVRELEKQDKAAEKAGRAAAKLEEEHRKLSLSNKSAEQSARIMEQAFLAEERAAEKVKTNYERLRATFDSSYAARMRLRQASQTLRAAVDAEIISVQEAAAMLRQYNAAANSSSAVATDLARRINRKGVITQQAGYQLGDFIVQVQSGTNAFVAFGQQATQVAGTLTLLGGKWLMIGSALGVAIPLLTAIGAVLMRTRQAAQDAASGVDVLSDTLSQARREMADMAFEIEALQRGFQDFREFALVRAIEQAQERVEELRAEIYELEQLGTITGPNQRELDLALQALNLAQEELETYQETRQERERIRAAEEASLALLEGMSQAAENVRTAYESLRNTAREIGDEFKDTQANALAQFEQKMEEAAEEARQAAQESRELKEEMAEAKREAELLAAIDIKSGIDQAADAASRLADNLAFARSLSASFQESSVRAGVASGAIPPQALQDLPQTDAERAYQDMLERRRRASRQAQSGGRSSGGGSAREQEDYLLNLQREADLKLQMIGLSEQEQRRLEITNELITRNLPVEDERIQKLIATEAALRQAMEAEERREQLMNSIQGNLEAGFMAMIDGSKSVEDAFKSMIRAILVDIARQAIVQPIASGITSFLFPGRASGGSVAAGNPYLVGENGPELVIPGRSGTVMNADLTDKAMGGGAPVVINQTFQFSANGDDSVKRIIAAEAPKIAALTQKQIVDQRRRGGQMRNVFG